jgi:dolichol-phosphate mannosyltransferase
VADNPLTLSVVCPAYNEEEVLPLFHRELAAVLARLPGHYRAEVIYVDDGSRDGTLGVLRSLAASDPRVRYLSFSRNFGHQAALTAGLEAARGDVVVSLDSDLQHPPGLIPELLERWRAGHEVVVTIRDAPPGPDRLENRLSRWFYRFMAWLSDTEVRPAAADFRLMSRSALDALLRMRETHRFLRGMVGWLGFPAAEVHYTPAARGAGRPKYDLRRKLRLAADGLLSFSKVPLQLPIAAGLPAVAFGLASWAYALLRGGSAGAFHLGSLYVLGGGVLCALGVIGEYLGRIYDEVRARPPYVVKEASGPAAPALLRPAGPPRAPAA